MLEGEMLFRGFSVRASRVVVKEKLRSKIPSSGKHFLLLTPFVYWSVTRLHEVA
jgi:hypothetical protein